MRNQKGQSTVEFALTLLLLMSFSFFFIHLALAFAWGSYTQYATFMSARAYLSAGATKDDQAERARRVILKTLKKGGSGERDRFAWVSQGIGGRDARDGTVTGFMVDSPSTFAPGDRIYSWQEGVRYKFRTRLFLMPFGLEPRDVKTRSNQVEMTSESWLGREPTYVDECLPHMSGKTRGIIDNGC